MFKRLAEAGAPVAITVDGRRVAARAGDTVAVAMIAAGIDHCRTTPVSGAPRAPYCLMGVCFECLVTVDGVGSRLGVAYRKTQAGFVVAQTPFHAYPRESRCDQCRACRHRLERNKWARLAGR